MDCRDRFTLALRNQVPCLVEPEKPAVKDKPLFLGHLVSNSLTELAKKSNWPCLYAIYNSVYVKKGHDQVAVQ